MGAPAALAVVNDLPKFAALPPAHVNVADGGDASYPDGDLRNLELYWRFLAHRMYVRKGMYSGKGDAYVYTMRVVTPPSPVDHLLSLTTFGNVYRHLDTGTKEWGSCIREEMGDPPKMRDGRGRVSDAFLDYCEYAWLACFFHMINFRY